MENHKPSNTQMNILKVFDKNRIERGGCDIRVAWEKSGLKLSFEDFKLEIFELAHEKYIANECDDVWRLALKGELAVKDRLRYSDESPKRSDARVAVRYPVSSGTRWGQIVIKIVSKDALIIKSHDRPSKRFHFVELGFADGRKHDLPDYNWELLKLIANAEGKYTGWPANGTSALQKRVQRIRGILKQLTGLNENPIKYVGKTIGSTRQGFNGYMTEFEISVAPHL